MAELEGNLSAERIDTWVNAASAQRVEVKLPKFKIEPDEPLTLSATLRELGLVRAFDVETADFTGMAPATEQLVISEAFHKAFIDVNEKGTEAAAATAVGMRAGAMPPQDEPAKFHADHPFLYLLRDTKSGAILFMGRVTDPS